LYKDRCGYGPRLPLIIVSPYSKVNYVSHQIIDQSSILRFIEDNWNLRQIGDQSFDEKAGSILDMFNFTSGNFAEKLYLDSSNGTEVASPR
jgi:phospholipase C